MDGKLAGLWYKTERITNLTLFTDKSANLAWARATAKIFCRFFFRNSLNMTFYANLGHMMIGQDKIDGLFSKRREIIVVLKQIVRCINTYKILIVALDTCFA